MGLHLAVGMWLSAPCEVLLSKKLLFTVAERGVEWDTAETTKQIESKFNAREMSKTFSNADNELRAYADWIEDDAPYSSAYTIHQFSNYVLELDYKWGERKFNPRRSMPRDAGIIFHVYGDRNKPWPSGLEFQLIEPDQCGMLVTVRTRVKTQVTDGIFDPHAQLTTIGKSKGTEHLRVQQPNPTQAGWNHVRLEISGSAGKFFHNGNLVLEFSDAEFLHPFFRTWQPLERGRIILQAEGAEVSYRNVTIAPLANIGRSLESTDNLSRK